MAIASRKVNVEGTTLYLKDVQDIFRKEEAAINKLKNSFDNLQQLIELDDDILVTNLQERSTTLQNNLSSWRAEQKVQFEYEAAQKDIAKQPLSLRLISKNLRDLKWLSSLYAN